jgi:hypothetical protein
VEGERVSIQCSDGSYFTAPVEGGTTLGYDRHGRMLDAYVSVTDGKYFVRSSPSFSCGDFHIQAP